MTSVMMTTLQMSLRLLLLLLLDCHMKRIQLRAEALLCKTLSKFTAPHWLCVRHGGVVVRVVGQQSAGCWFNTQLRHFRLVLAASKDLIIPTVTWILFQQLLCSVSFKQMQIFNQTMVFFSKRHVYKHSSDMRKYVISTTLRSSKEN